MTTIDKTLTRCDAYRRVFAAFLNQNDAILTVFLGRCETMKHRQTTLSGREIEREVKGFIGRELLQAGNVTSRFVYVQVIRDVFNAVDRSDGSNQAIHFGGQYRATECNPALS